MLINNSELSIADAIRDILANHVRTTVVVNIDHHLVGIVSEGDILRAIWNGHSLESPIINCMNTNPVLLNADVEIESKKILEYLKNNGIVAVPLIDSNKKFIKMISVLDYLEQ